MEKFLYFANSTADACIIPVREVYEFDSNHASDGTDLTVKFKSGLESDDGIGEEALACVITENTFAATVKAIANEVRSGKDPFIVFADDVNSEFVHANITALTTAINLTA